MFYEASSVCMVQYYESNRLVGPVASITTSLVLLFRIREGLFCEGIMFMLFREGLFCEGI